MGLFGKSFEDKGKDAVEAVRTQFPNASVNAQAGDDVVTLTGRAPDTATKAAIMTAFNAAVETKNTLNQISVDTPVARPGATPEFGKLGQPFGTPLSGTPGTTTASEHRMHEVASGDTLSALAKRYYGDASKYNRIFEANRDQLNDPDKIRVGQKLKIPT